MHVSLNEIGATAERAARGAGATPGADTEAGHYAAWLEGHGLPALAPMAASLASGPASALVPAARVALGGASLVFHAGALIDLAVARAARLDLEAARDPLFLVAAAVRFARAGLTIRIAWGGAEARLGPDHGVTLHAAAAPPLAPARPVDIAVDLGGAPARWAALLDDRALDRRWLAAVAHGVEVDDGTWTALKRFALRTYVPASALSRSRGAGAEVDDSA